MGYLPTWAYGASLLITSLKSQISPEKHKVSLVARPSLAIVLDHLHHNIEPGNEDT